jgi:hypothetical protein
MEHNAEFWNVFDMISIIGYPLVAWLSYRDGRTDGMIDTLESLHDQGLIQLEEEEGEQS